MYDSNGPSVRIRGSALQIYEKYSQLARDSQRTDRIAAENLAQHAEHYYRLANVNNALANGSNSGADRRGDQGRPNGAGQDGEADERYPQASDGESRQPEEAGGQQQQHGQQQRQDYRQDQQKAPQRDQRQQRQEQPRQAEAQQDRQAESQAAEVTVVAPPPPAPVVEPAAADSPPQAAQTDKPPRRRRTPRPRKTEPETSSGGDTEPVEA